MWLGRLTLPVVRAIHLLRVLHECQGDGEGDAGRQAQAGPHLRGEGSVDSDVNKIFKLSISSPSLWVSFTAWGEKSCMPSNKNVQKFHPFRNRIMPVGNTASSTSGQPDLMF